MNRQEKRISNIEKEIKMKKQFAKFIEDELQKLDLELKEIRGKTK